MHESQIFGICPMCKKKVTEEDHVTWKFVEVQVLCQRRLRLTRGDKYNKFVVFHPWCSDFTGLIPPHCYQAR